MKAISASFLLLSAIAPAVARAETVLEQPAVIVAADGGMGSRRLTYKDDLFGTLRPYNLPAAPAVGAEISLFPAAIFTDGKGAWFGLHGRIEAMPGIDSMRGAHDESLPTTAWAFSASMRFRRPFSFGAIWVDMGAAGRTFTIEKAGITDPDVPSVRYLGPSFGFGGEIRAPFGLTIAPRVTVADWTSLGDVRSKAWFPNAKAIGVDLGLRFSLRASYGFAPYLDLAWSRQILYLDPEPGDARVAGGAADDTVTGRLGIAWTLFGKPRVDR